MTPATGTPDAILTAAQRLADELAAVNPAALDTAGHIRHRGLVNPVFAAAKRTMEAASYAYGRMLTDAVAREVRAVFPDAVLLSVSVRRTYHAVDGRPDPHCEGHDPVLVPKDVVDGNGDLLGTLPPGNPVWFYLESLSEVMDLVPGSLHLESQDWVLPDHDTLFPSGPRTVLDLRRGDTSLD